MKHFIFVIKPLRSNLGRDKQCDLYRIKSNEPVFVGSRKFSFESDGQAAINTAVQFKALTKADHAKVKPTQCQGDVNTSVPAWREAGVAKFTQVG